MAPQWDDFWTLYPRRVAKKDALKAWSRLKPAQQMAAIVACAAWRRVWATKDLDYLPYPATWINGERWEDELPPEFTQSNASHVAAALPEQGERGGDAGSRAGAASKLAMPDDLRAGLPVLLCPLVSGKRPSLAGSVSTLLGANSTGSTVDSRAVWPRRAYRVLQGRRRQLR